VFVVPEAVKELVVHNASLKYSILSGTTLALSGLGDAFLYVYLPNNYQSIGLTVFWVGILLSINRFTRLFLNSQVAYVLSKHGIKTITVTTTVLAILTTLSYGFFNSIFLWVIVRVLWGLSFSTLRLSSIIYALQYNKQGFSLGLSKSITEIGSVLALLIGPVLIMHFERGITFILLASLSVIGLLSAIALPQIKIKPVSRKDLILSFPSSLNILVLLNTFVVEGMLVVLIGRLLYDGLNISALQVLTIAGFYLAYRRICLIFFSPLSGWLADKFGFQSLFNYTALFLAIGISLIAFGFAIPGIIVTFTFSAMNTSVSPGSALTQPTSMVKDISDNATWRDIGAAFGTLTGSLLLNFSYLHIVFMVALFPIFIGLIVQFNNSKKKTIYNGIS
jgi:predicted MFS family arabinose efflux permease